MSDTFHTPSGKTLGYDILIRILTTLPNSSLLSLQRCSKAFYALVTPILYSHIELDYDRAASLFAVIGDLPPGEVAGWFTLLDFAKEPTQRAREQPVDLQAPREMVSADLSRPLRLRIALSFIRSMTILATATAKEQPHMAVTKTVVRTLRLAYRQLVFPNLRSVSLRPTYIVPLSPHQLYGLNADRETIQLVAEGSQIAHICLHDIGHADVLTSLLPFSDPFRRSIDPFGAGVNQPLPRRMETITIHNCDCQDYGVYLYLNKLRPHKRLRVSRRVPYWESAPDDNRGLLGDAGFGEGLSLEDAGIEEGGVQDTDFEHTGGEEGGSEEGSAFEYEKPDDFQRQEVEKLVCDVWTAYGASEQDSTLIPSHGWTIVMPGRERIESWQKCFDEIYHEDRMHNAMFRQERNCEIHSRDFRVLLQLDGDGQAQNENYAHFEVMRQERGEGFNYVEWMMRDD